MSTQRGGSSVASARARPIDAVRDPVPKVKGEKDDEAQDSTPADKRLLVVETEFARTLRAATRDGNVLSQVMRQAWDTGELATLTRSSPLKATDAHISIIGHTARDELVRSAFPRWRDRQRHRQPNSRVGARSSVEDAAVLWRLLDDDSVLASPTRTAKAALRARRLGRLQPDNGARDLWAHVYPTLSEGKSGLVGRVTARAEAQAVRLSVVYAALDGSSLIRQPHLRAALALWNYAAASAAWIFGVRTGNGLADKIREALRSCPQGLSQNDVWQVAARHGNKQQLDDALRLLEASGEVRREQRATGGRPATYWIPLGPPDRPIEQGFFRFRRRRRQPPAGRLVGGRPATEANEGSADAADGSSILEPAPGSSALVRPRPRATRAASSRGRRRQRQRRRRGLVKTLPTGQRSVRLRDTPASPGPRATAALAAPPAPHHSVCAHAGASPLADGHGLPAMSPPAPAYSAGKVVISVVAICATSPCRSTRARRGAGRGPGGRRSCRVVHAATRPRQPRSRSRPRRRARRGCHRATRQSRAQRRHMGMADDPTSASAAGEVVPRWHVNTTRPKMTRGQALPTAGAATAGGINDE